MISGLLSDAYLFMLTTDTPIDQIKTKDVNRSLSTIRRIAIVFMIFVNDGAGGYWWLEHATWNGMVAGDLVFPAFLWIMGVCIPLAVKSAFAKGIPRWKIVLHILRVCC